MTDDKREALAALEHEQWAHWTGYMLEVLEPLLAYGRGVMREASGHGFGDAKAIKSLEALQRWFRQIQTPYADLTESEKDSDREWADKVLEITGTEDLAQHEITQFLRYLQACGGHDAPFDLKAHLPRIQSLLDAHDKPGPT